MTQLVLNKDIELKRSLDWIKDSFVTFRESPVQFIVLGILSTLLGLIPLFGAFVGPIFVAQFIRLARQVELGQKINFSHLMDGMFSNPTVVRLGFLNFMFSAIWIIAQYLAENWLNRHGVNDISSSYIMLLFFIPMLFVQLAMWLAPVICLFDPQTSLKTALSLSLKAGLYSILTLLCYSILVALFTILAIIPLGLGLLLWVPILNITTYHIYKSMFTNIAV
jgi:uncharacterized membrane protein YhdT